MFSVTDATFWPHIFNRVGVRTCVKSALFIPYPALIHVCGPSF